MPRFRPIASLLISRIIMLAVACMLLFGGVHAWWEYRKGLQEFRRTTHTLVSNSMISLSGALWDIDPAMVNQQLRWLAQLPAVGHVLLRVTATGEVYEAGDGPLPGREPAVSLPILPPPFSQSRLQLGELLVWEDGDYYLSALRDSMLRVLLGYALLTTLVCLMVAWVMRRELRQPLHQIARFAASLKPNELSRPLVLDRPQRDEVDEIDLVIQGFQQLQQDLRGYIEHLDLLVAQRTAQLESLVEEVKRMSLTDALTGCYNRRAMDERLAAEIERCRRLGLPLSVLFVDVDHFKQVNDTYGHAAGDAVLREVAQRCSRNLQVPRDWMVRYGGEEFLIILPERTSYDAAVLGEQLCQAIRGQAVPAYGLLELRVTASVGIAQLDASDTQEGLLARADAMLYDAKHAGRDCMRAAHVPL